MTTNRNLILNGVDLFDAMTSRDEEDRDYSPVPAEYRDMSFDEIVEILDEQALEDAYAREAQAQIPHRWM